VRHPELSSTHSTPLQSPEQQSDGWAQVAASARHSPAGATQVFATQFPEQQSPPAEQLAPSGAAVHAGGCGSAASELLHAVALSAVRSKAARREAGREASELVGRMIENPPPV
jgi:hypothetical protein